MNDKPEENPEEKREDRTGQEALPDEEGFFLISINDYYDLLMEQQEQM